MSPFERLEAAVLEFRRAVVDHEAVKAQAGHTCPVVLAKARCMEAEARLAVTQAWVGLKLA